MTDTQDVNKEFLVLYRVDYIEAESVAMIYLSGMDCLLEDYMVNVTIGLALCQVAEAEGFLIWSLKPFCPLLWACS